MQSALYLMFFFSFSASGRHRPDSFVGITSHRVISCHQKNCTQVIIQFLGLSTIYPILQGSHDPPACGIQSFVLARTSARTLFQIRTEDNIAWKTDGRRPRPTSEEEGTIRGTSRFRILHESESRSSVWTGILDFMILGLFMVHCQRRRLPPMRRSI